MMPVIIKDRAKFANEADAYELYLYSLNTTEPYHRYVEPTIHALERHAKRGRYDVDRALVAWKRVADAIAKCYARDYATEGWNFGLAERCAVAVYLERSERENVFYDINDQKEG